MIKTVKKGFITRFSKEEFWEEEVVLLPPGIELVDGDAIPYYIENDGILYEYYSHFAPNNAKIYCLKRYYDLNMQVRVVSTALFNLKTVILEELKTLFNFKKL